MCTILTIWFMLCVFSMFLMSLTEDAELYFNDIKRFLYFKNFFVFLLSMFILFVYLPLNITYLLREVFKKK
jgi:hypothetical protein